MTARRVRTLLLSGLVPVIVIALVFGNQWAVAFAVRHDLVGRDIGIAGNGIGQSLERLVVWLQFPSWRVSGSFSFVAVRDFSLLLLFAAVALLGLAGARAVDPRRGAMSVLILGWWATVVAGGVVGLIRGLLTVIVGDFPSQAASTFVWSGMESGALFGLVYGWLTGVAMLLAFRATRPTEEAAAPTPYGGAPSAQGPPPLPQRVPQTSYSARPPGGSARPPAGSPQHPAGQWPPPQQQQPPWPAQPGPGAGYPPPPAYGPPAAESDPGSPRDSAS